MKSGIFLLLSAVITGCVCQTTTTSTLSSSSTSLWPGKKEAQAREITDARVSQRDKDIRNAFNSQQQGQVLDVPTPHVEQPAKVTEAAVVVPAVALPAGTTITTPPQHDTVANLQPVVETAPAQQSDTRSLLSILGSKSFMDILNPRIMPSDEATRSLIPPLVTDGMKSTLAQQQKAVPQQQSLSQPYLYNPNYPYQQPQQQGYYPGGQQALPFGYGQYPQQNLLGGMGQSPIITGNQYSGLGNAFTG
ncbi:hypothetical protein BV898_05168 [Hypsibius exemplaris]|uniref:Uncharacterized protein n=1 Tax=Hypsibius exemplaris TaxID=2072580 RepID=A0A1W0X0H9_HYPEX|nr:hypothetical protein BV898_05168 [Hypsibius exemplaris]